MPGLFHCSGAVNHFFAISGLDAVLGSGGERDAGLRADGGL
jgi:hypothetical protein